MGNMHALVNQRKHHSSLFTLSAVKRLSITLRVFCRNPSGRLPMTGAMKIADTPTGYEIEVDGLTAHVEQDADGVRAVEWRHRGSLLVRRELVPDPLSDRVRAWARERPPFRSTLVQVGAEAGSHLVHRRS